MIEFVDDYSSEEEAKPEEEVREEAVDVPSVRNSFFSLAKELEVSNNQAKRSWYIFKHLPIKENDSVWMFDNNMLLSTWLSRYGLARSVKILLTNEEAFEKANTYLKTYPHLPQIEAFDVTGGKMLSDLERPDLLIANNMVIGLLEVVFNALYIISDRDNIDFPKMYLKMNRNDANFQCVQMDGLNLNFVDILPENFYDAKNDTKHLLLLDILCSLYKNNNEKYTRKWRYVPSFPFKNSVELTKGDPFSNALHQTATSLIKDWSNALLDQFIAQKKWEFAAIERVNQMTPTRSLEFYVLQDIMDTLQSGLVIQPFLYKDAILE